MFSFNRLGFLTLSLSIGCQWEEDNAQVTRGNARLCPGAQSPGPRCAGRSLGVAFQHSGPPLWSSAPKLQLRPPRLPLSQMGRCPKGSWLAGWLAGWIQSIYGFPHSRHIYTALPLKCLPCLDRIIEKTSRGLWPLCSHIPAQQPPLS